MNDRPNLEFIIFGALFAVAVLLLLFFFDSGLAQPVANVKYGPCQ
jgi:hypothetical protein